MIDAEQKILDCAKELGISVTSEFVPWSKSRNRDEQYKSLNWIVSLKRNNRVLLKSNYEAGVAHCPSYKTQGLTRLSVHVNEKVNWECEHGKEAGESGLFPKIGGKELLPDPADVLYSLVQDSSAIDYSNFEDWAESYGWDSDSRKAEAIYKSCLKTALALRNGLGEDDFKRLREVCADY